MNGFNLKEAMEQIHISKEMQEEIVMNVKRQMESGKRNRKKTVASVAAIILIAGISGISVQAVVKNVVKERMEALPKEKLQSVAAMVQEQEAEADGFLREYSDNEKARIKQLRQDYQNGIFPEKELIQVDKEEDVVEGSLCYIKSTGDFYLPDRELTDEELLEIIDFSHVRSYAIEQSPAAKEAREEYLEEKARLHKIVQEADGISEEEAIEIARKQMESELGEKKEEMELMTDIYGQGAFLIDISNTTQYEHERDIAYTVGFRNVNDRTIYACIIDAVDGSILRIQK